jgi:VanZ family protein
MSSRMRRDVSSTPAVRPPRTYNMARLLLDRRSRLVCALLRGVGWVGVAGLLLLPQLSIPPSGPKISDLLAHALLFGTMALAVVGFSRRPGQIALLSFVTIALGAALEFAQSVVPYRVFEVADLVANGVGGFAGFSVALLVLYFLIRPAELRFRAVTT